MKSIFEHEVFFKQSLESNWKREQKKKISHSSEINIEGNYARKLQKCETR